MPVRRSRETHSSQVSFPIMWASSHLPAQMSFQRPLGWEALCGACSLFSAFSHSVEHGEPHQNSFIYLNIYWHCFVPGMVLGAGDRAVSSTKPASALVELTLPRGELGNT